MSVFADHEREVVRILAGATLPPDRLDDVLDSAELVSIEHTGKGYFLTVRHPALPAERSVLHHPVVLGAADGVECGFVVFVEGGELVLECYSLLPESVPEDFRERPVQVSVAVASEPGSGSPAASRPDGALVARFATREGLGVAFMVVTLFWSAGRVDWWAGWALVAVTGAWVVATGQAIIRIDPALLAERLGPRKGAKRWDIGIMSVFGLLQFAVLILAGLDQRYGWTTWISPALQVAGLIGCIAGHALVVWATACNAFFSQIVRIQTERGHTVCTRGPYSRVRHPGYSGTILSSLAAPILLASGVGLVLGVASAMLILLRTALEDRTLRRELPGYEEYTQVVRHRLVPGIW